MGGEKTSMFCPECGEQVRYIAPNWGGGLPVQCNRKSVIIYTENGRRIEGYQVHECKTGNDHKQEKAGGSG